MLVNPLFNQDDTTDNDPKKDDGYVFRHSRARKIQPISQDLPSVAPNTATHHSPHTAYPRGIADKHADPAVELIRNKVQALYNNEPDVREELQEVVKPAPRPSKHQQFMHGLSTSGKSLAQIQTEWHDYYIHLSDKEKHEVWSEFYQANARQPSAYTTYVAQQQASGNPIGKRTPATPQPLGHGQLPHAASPAEPTNSKIVVGEHLPAPNYKAQRSHRTRSQIKKKILNKVNISAEAQRKAKHHFQSLMFGIATGLIVLIVFLFSFFNEIIIAPFVQPSRHASATPIIISSNTVAADDSTQVIIPKINVQIPTIYNVQSADEDVIENNLKDGVVHYPTTVLPGQVGNTAFFGHSSNNIFNKGQYKFAFVLLHTLVPGDIFYLTYNKTVYTYRVYDKKIVPPSEVSVLNNVPDKTATATLITCDPPGTSTNRLVVWGEQISPDPTTATTPTASNANLVPTTLPSNGPTLWTRLWNWIF